MMTAAQYGNAGAYFEDNSNFQTAYYIGFDSAENGQWNRAVYYSVMRDSSVIPPAAATPTQRLTGEGRGGAAFPGWCGPRPVAFPFSPDWNFDVPMTD
jgi:hypothetical protein